jgi:arylsulfatase A-like enzyme
MTRHMRPQQNTFASMKLILALLSAVLVGAHALHAAEPSKPNIVFILADDLGYADLSCYGAAKIKTPHLDHLATEGMKFTDFYATGCVCTPTRASLLTGCYPKRVGLHVGVLSPGCGQGLNPAETTIAGVLRARGYATACIGKWHLGEEPEVMPTRHGFDSYFGMIGPNHGRSDLYRDATLIEKSGEVDKSQLTKRYTEEAVKFIRASKDRPFFLYLAHSAVHIPLFASDEFRGKSAAGLYGDMTEELDWSVGRVLETLKELNLEKNTLVVFTSDNGQSGVAAPPLHGGKGSTWEAGHRVPCIARLPGRIPAGSVTHEMTVMFDWTLTLASLADGKFPAGHKHDGRDLWPVLEAKPQSAALHDSFVYYGREGLPSTIREGRWKLHVIAPVEKWAGKLPPEALLDKRPQDALPWLYDLSNDISETQNVASQHPEVVERLRKDLEQMDATLTREARPVFSKAK